MNARDIVREMLPPAILNWTRRVRKLQKHTEAQFDIQRDKVNKELFNTIMGYLWSSGEIAAGDYYEFGICGAYSFRSALFWAHKWDLNKMRFYAFDSFQGLPATGHLTMTEEAFWKSIRRQGIFTDKVETIKGFYDKTLTDEVREKFIAKQRPAIFVNVDCDLHDSAELVFRFIEPLIQPGTVIYVDDFYTSFMNGRRIIHGGMWGTARAFFDFAQRSKLKFYPFMNAGFWGRAFIAYDPSIPSGPPA